MLLWPPVNDIAIKMIGKCSKILLLFEWPDINRTKIDGITPCNLGAFRSVPISMACVH